MLPAQTDTLADHGINIPPGASGQVRATCPQCSHDRRKPADRCLSINADESVWLCFNCGWAGGLGGREYNSVPPTKKQAAQKARIEAEKKRIAVAKNVWELGIPLSNPEAQPARRYIELRGLREAWDLLKPDTFRFHPDLGYWQNGKLVGKSPCLVAKVIDRHGNFRAIHRIYLEKGGSKITWADAKKSLGPVKRGYVKIIPAQTHVAITEGIETGLAVYLATGIPVFAALSTSGMERIILGEEIKTVCIFADKDKSGAGQRAAGRLARRLTFQGREVKKPILPAMEIPPGRKGVDFLDQYYPHNHGVPA